MPATLTYAVGEICNVGDHGTLHVFLNGVEQFSTRIDIPANYPGPLTGQEQKDLAVSLLRYAMQRAGFIPSTATQLNNQLTGKGIELDLVTLP